MDDLDYVSPDELFSRFSGLESTDGDPFWNASPMLNLADSGNLQLKDDDDSAFALLPNNLPKIGTKRSASEADLDGEDELARLLESCKSDLRESSPLAVPSLQSLDSSDSLVQVQAQNIIAIDQKRHPIDEIIVQETLRRLKSDDFIQSIVAQPFYSSNPDLASRWSRKHTWTVVRHIMDVYRSRTSRPGNLTDIDTVRHTTLKVIRSFYSVNRLQSNNDKLNCRIKRDLRIAMNALFVSGMCTTIRADKSSLSDERIAMHFLIQSLLASDEKAGVSSSFLKVAFVYSKTITDTIVGMLEKKSPTSGKSEANGRILSTPGRAANLISHVVVVYKTLGLVEDGVVHLKQSDSSKKKEPVATVLSTSTLRSAYSKRKNKVDVLHIGHGIDDINPGRIIRFIKETGTEIQ